MECEYCSREASFFVTEQYDAPDMEGASVTRQEVRCDECVRDAEPEQLDQAFANYEFTIEPVPWKYGMTQVDGPDS